MEPAAPHPMKDILVDIYPNGTSVFRDISKGSRCHAHWRALLYCFENSLRETRSTQRCNHFIEAWDKCLNQKSPLPPLHRTD